MLLEVRRQTTRRMGFYRSLGFSETGRRPRYYADPVEDAVLMAMQLQAARLGRTVCDVVTLRHRQADISTRLE